MYLLAGCLCISIRQWAPRRPMSASSCLGGIRNMEGNRYGGHDENVGMAPDRRFSGCLGQP